MLLFSKIVFQFTYGALFMIPFFATKPSDTKADLEELLDTLASVYRDNKIERIKYSNKANGVEPQKIHQLNELANRIKTNTLGELSDETALKLIDVLTLYSNHLDQQVPQPISAEDMELRHQKVLTLLTAAHQIATQLIPELTSIETQHEKNWFNKYNSQRLSSISMNLHYYGKALRYQSQCRFEQRQPLLQAALDMANYLEQVDSKQDLHRYVGRIATFTMPIFFELQKTQQFEQAIELMKNNLASASQSKNYFHIIQSHTYLAGTYNLMNQAIKKGAELGLQHAKDALKTLHDCKNIDDFSTHCIHFNARQALMEAYQNNDEPFEATRIAQEILSEHESNPNCGAKKAHLEAAQNIVSLNNNLSLAM